MNPYFEKYCCSLGVIEFKAAHVDPLIGGVPPEEVEITVRPRKPRSLGESICTVFLITVVIWLLVEIVPAFFDGRVAQVVR
jgi:hypothetical protein